MRLPSLSSIVLAVAATNVVPAVCHIYHFDWLKDMAYLTAHAAGEPTKHHGLNPCVVSL